MTQIIKKEFVEKITERSKQDPRDLLDIIRQFGEAPRREGASYKTVCPLCGGEHSLVITPGKQLFKCFNCNQLSGKYPLDYLMKGQGMDFPAAIEWLADYYHEMVEYVEFPKKKEVRKKPTGKKFCERMLQESGLTSKDLEVTVTEDGAKVVRSTFVSGTIGRDGKIDKEGDDAVILYYDLDGNQCKFISEVGKESVEKPYTRVRYQFPEQHLDKNKRSIKYRSPAGAPTFIYYPQFIRSRYQKGEHIQTLYIQEGEKKAEKACKHGIPSVAVSGIQNIGYKGTLPEDIIRLVETCTIKEVIFMLDADCFDLTHTITVNDPIDRRPKNFYYAVRNFKDYFAKLKNHNIYVELYFGHIIKEKTPDKGTDDLLANTLKGKEDELLKDLQYAQNEKSGTGKWVQLHKITALPDSKIQEFWCLQAPQEFCKRYLEQLRPLPEFTISRRRMRINENDQLESVQPIEPDEQFWTVTHKKEENIYNFCYVGAKYFLEHRGFYRYRKPSGDYDFVHQEQNIVQVVRHYEVGDYMRNFTKDCLQKEVLEMLYKGGAQYLGPNSLTMLDFFQEAFDTPSRGIQKLFFQNEIWEITADHIKKMDYSQLHQNIWADEKKDYAADLIGPLIDVDCQDGVYSYRITPLGEKCDFLRFLENASNFTWRKDNPTEAERNANAQHLISKLAAFGFLLSSVKDPSVSKAVIGMDGKQSEIGVSNGRSGKSLLGEAVRRAIKTRYYNGKEFGAGRGGNQFIWDGIDEKTRMVFIDDCQRDFDFEIMFGLITGDWPVNPKGERSFILPFRISPKIYITTNHAIDGDGSSFSDRQWSLAFSDYYNSEHKPVDDFKVHFFDEWEGEQWDMFWNLVAQSIQIYFRFGYVPAPGDRLAKRKLLQEIGEEFILWADEYYSSDEHFNQRLARKDVYQSLMDFVGPKRSGFYSPKSFKAKLRKYCQLKDYIFNPQAFDPIKQEYVIHDDDGRPKMDDKSNGIEYFTIGNNTYYTLHPVQPTIEDPQLDFVEQPDIDPDDLP